MKSAEIIEKAGIVGMDLQAFLISADSCVPLLEDKKTISDHVVDFPRVEVFISGQIEMMESFLVLAHLVKPKSRLVFRLTRLIRRGKTRAGHEKRKGQKEKRKTIF